MQNAVKIIVGREDTNALFDAFGELPRNYWNEDLIYLAQSLHPDCAPSFSFSAAELDELAARRQLAESKETSIGTGYCYSRLFLSLPFWLQTAELLSKGRDSVYADSAWRAYAIQTKDLLHDLLSHVAAAWSETIFFVPADQEEPMGPGVEVLKRYQRFTRHICDFAEAVWPEFTWQKLRKLS